MTTSTEQPRNAWWIPAATFAVGLLLGGGVIAATMSGGDGDTSAGPPTASVSAPAASASPSSSSEVTLTIPSECLQVAEDSQKVLDLVNDAATAVRDLDAARLSDIVRDLQVGQKTLSDQAAACRDSAEPPSVP